MIVGKERKQQREAIKIAAVVHVFVPAIGGDEKPHAVVQIAKLRIQVLQRRAPLNSPRIINAEFHLKEVCYAFFTGT
jgi:hypothetical protein